MAKVIVERPRYGRGFKFPRASIRSDNRPPLDELHKREGIGRPWSGNPKSLNENLAPLRRYLRSQVGRPWDDVYGEICQRINRGSAVQLHIWQHLVEYVCTDPHVVCGDVGRRDGGLRYAFFVHPRTGVLRENPEYLYRRRRRLQATPPADRIRVDPTREYRLMNGLWYELTFAPVPPRMHGIYDPVLKKGYPELTPGELCGCHGRAVYVVRKLQLNKKEIRRLPQVQ